MLNNSSLIMFQNLEIRIHFYFHSARGRYRRCQHLIAFFQLEQEQLHHSMSGKLSHKVLAFYEFFLICDKIIEFQVR